MYNKYSVKNFVETRGEREIRTPVRVSPKHAFQACTLNHSDTSPFYRVGDERLELPTSSL